jgi:hypothetical protein
MGAMLAGAPSAELAKQRRSAAAAITWRLTVGSSVAAKATQAPSRSEARKARRTALTSPAAARSSSSPLSLGATTTTVARSATRSETRRVATRPAPTTTVRRPERERLTG